MAAENPGSLRFSLMLKALRICPVARGPPRGISISCPRRSGRNGLVGSLPFTRPTTTVETAGAVAGEVRSRFPGRKSFSEMLVVSRGRSSGALRGGPLAASPAASPTSGRKARAALLGLGVCTSGAASFCLTRGTTVGPHLLFLLCSFWLLGGAMWLVGFGCLNDP